MESILHSRAGDSAKQELRRVALFWLCEPDPVAKTAGVTTLVEDWARQRLDLDTESLLAENGRIPGRPAKPELISPRTVKQRGTNTVEGRAILIHALAHIEFNAINLALDAIWRFPGMPADYYSDWLKVAAEEALHFSLLSNHLATLGHRYGDFPAHDGLWEMAEKTKDDILARIALVPRTLEARGLDVTPPIRAKLAQAGDVPAAEILDIILRDEIGHVGIGNRWFGWLCRQQEQEPATLYQELLQAYDVPALRGPLNIEARRQAGFCDDELQMMAAVPSVGMPG